MTPQKWECLGIPGNNVKWPLPPNNVSGLSAWICSESSTLTQPHLGSLVSPNSFRWLWLPLIDLLFGKSSLQSLGKPLCPAKVTTSDRFLSQIFCLFCILFKPFCTWHSKLWWSIMLVMDLEATSSSWGGSWRAQTLSWMETSHIRSS